MFLQNCCIVQFCQILQFNKVAPGVLKSFASGLIHAPSRIINKASFNCHANSETVEIKNGTCDMNDINVPQGLIFIFFLWCPFTISFYSFCYLKINFCEYPWTLVFAFISTLSSSTVSWVSLSTGFRWILDD